MIYALEGEKLPRFYPIYSGTSGVKSIARYEDRPLEQSVTGQIDALGSHTVESPKEADILFGVNVPGNKQGDHALQEDKIGRASCRDTAEMCTVSISL